jgi:hypothetical protein
MQNTLYPLYRSSAVSRRKTLIGPSKNPEKLSGCFTPDRYCQRA